MVWESIRSWLGLAAQGDVDQAHEEIDRIRDHVLTGSHALQDRVDVVERDLGSVEQELTSLEADVRSHDEAIEHIVEALSHIGDKTSQEPENNNIKTLEDRLSEIEEKFERLESLGVFDATSKKVDNPSGRPDGRPSGEDGRQPDVEGLVHDVQSGKEIWKKATNTQKEVIKTLYESGYPLSYREISDRLGKSVSTVKNHINNLKATGARFEEEIGQNNEKKYMIDDRIQAFLTMRLND